MRSWKAGPGFGGTRPGPFETGTEAGYIWFGSWGRVYPGRVSTSGPPVWGSGYCQVVDLVSYWSDAPITTQPLNLFIYLQIFTGLVSIPSLEAYPAHLHFPPPHPSRWVKFPNKSRVCAYVSLSPAETFLWMKGDVTSQRHG